MTGEKTEGSVYAGLKSLLTSWKRWQLRWSGHDAGRLGAGLEGSGAPRPSGPVCRQTVATTQATHGLCVRAQPPRPGLRSPCRAGGHPAAAPSHAPPEAARRWGAAAQLCPHSVPTGAPPLGAELWAATSGSRWSDFLSLPPPSPRQPPPVPHRPPRGVPGGRDARYLRGRRHGAERRPRVRVRRRSPLPADYNSREAAGGATPAPGRWLQRYGLPAGPGGGGRTEQQGHTELQDHTETQDVRV